MDPVASLQNLFDSWTLAFGEIPREVTVSRRLFNRLLDSRHLDRRFGRYVDSTAYPLSLDYIHGNSTVHIKQSDEERIDD